MGLLVRHLDKYPPHLASMEVYLRNRLHKLSEFEPPLILGFVNLFSSNERHSEFKECLMVKMYFHLATFLVFLRYAEGDKNCRSGPYNKYERPHAGGNARFISIGRNENISHKATPI